MKLKINKWYNTDDILRTTQISKRAIKTIVVWSIDNGIDLMSIDDIIDIKNGNVDIKDVDFQNFMILGF